MSKVRAIKYENNFLGDKSMSCVPVINISPLLLPADKQTQFDISREIRFTYEMVGFFQITGHGVDESLIDGMIA